MVFCETLGPVCDIYTSQLSVVVVFGLSVVKHNRGDVAKIHVLFSLKEIPDLFSFFWLSPAHVVPDGLGVFRKSLRLNASFTLLHHKSYIKSTFK